MVACCRSSNDPAGAAKSDGALIHTEEEVKLQTSTLQKYVKEKQMLKLKDSVHWRFTKTNRLVDKGKLFLIAQMK